MTGVYGKSSQEYKDAVNSTLFPTYRQFPIVFTSGRGTRLRDTDGKEYIDFVAGIATCNLVTPGWPARPCVKLVLQRCPGDPRRETDFFDAPRQGLFLQQRS